MNAKHMLPVLVFAALTGAGVEDLEIAEDKSIVYGRAGNTWGNVAAQAAGMEKEMGDDVDAIFIFAGTNDYGGSRPLGNWYDEKEGVVNWWGQSCRLKQRIINLSALPGTYRVCTGK